VCCVGCVGVLMFGIVCGMNKTAWFVRDVRPGHVLLLLLLPSMQFSWLIFFVAADIAVATFFAATSAMHKRPESRVNLRLKFRSWQLYGLSGLLVRKCRQLCLAAAAPSLSLSLSLSLSICLSHTHIHTHRHTYTRAFSRHPYLLFAHIVRTRIWGGEGLRERRCRGGHGCNNNRWTNLSLALSLYIYISLSHTHTHALSHTHTNTYTYTFTHTCSVVIHISCLSILYVPESEGQMAVGREDAEVGMAATTAGEQVSLSLSHTYTHSLSHTHTYIHTYTNTRSVALSLVCPYCTYQNPT